MRDDNSDLLHQASKDPFDSLSKTQVFIDDVSGFIEWEQLGLLSDQQGNLIFLLLADSDIKVSFRANLSQEDFKLLIKNNLKGKPSIDVRLYQGRTIQSKDLSSLMALSKLWDQTANQSSQLPLSKTVTLIKQLLSGKSKKGRGKGFSKATRDKVNFDSHGYCMFVGCGEKLILDELSGQKGNFGYLAHNVASSEQGERGLPVLSGELANDPNNVLLLCDKHHRLIDKVAACDYDAITLSKMRNEHVNITTQLLNGLRYAPMPVYTVLLPVNKNVVAAPSNKEIADCLSKIETRMQGERQDIFDNDGMYLSAPHKLKEDTPELVNEIVGQLRRETKKSGHKAAFFAFGPMPILIALGAALGNKSNYIPMLRYRDGNCWMWPNDELNNQFYTVQHDPLTERDNFIITIGFTAEPESMLSTAEQLNNTLNAQWIRFVARPDFMGNGAISHPKSGFHFSAELQRLFHDLKSTYKAKTIHLFVCASNAASVFIGQAYDLHHPEVVVYDFCKNEMKPYLVLNNDSEKTSVKIVNH